MIKALPFANFPRADARQIFHRPIRAAFFQFLQRRAAGGNSQNFCSNKFSAADVKWRITNHDDFLCHQIFPEHTFAAFKRGGSNVIAVFIVVGKSAELKNFPKPEAAQLDFRAQPDVAGEQSKHRRIRQRLQVADEFAHAVAYVAVTVRKNMVEPENVALKKLREMFRRFGQRVDFEKFADKAHVGAPGEFYLFGAVMQVEFRRESFFESLRAGVTRVNERAVNVEQNEPHHAQ